MKTTLTLKSKIWEKGVLKRTVNQHFSGMAKRLENKLKTNIDTSRPAGRLYRRRAITARRSKRLDAAGFRAVKSSRSLKKTRSVVGYNFHRASAEGQPPARDTSKLYRSIIVRRNNNYGITARVKAKAVAILDSPLRLNRPFFKQPIREFYEQEFKPELKAEIAKLK